MLHFLRELFCFPFGHRHRHVRIAIRVQGVLVFLKPNEVIHMAVEATVGHTITSTIVYLDANGNPMLTTPTPDSPPSWAQTTPATDTLSVSADGNTAADVGIAAGTDTLSVTLMVGGITFSATQLITIDAEPQVLTSVAIASTVS